MSVRVAYIIGDVRSGSTMLDIALGNMESVHSSGELSWFAHCWKYSVPCSCGAPCTKCAFWSAVKKTWDRMNGDDCLDLYESLRSRFERIRKIPFLFTQQLFSSAQFRRYAVLTCALFEAIQEVSEKEIIVDSSKNPGRSLALSMIAGIDMHPIHLIRDGRGVLFSRKKTAPENRSRGLQEPRPLPAWRSSLSWLLVNQVAELVTRRFASRAVQLRYEDLFQDTPGFAAKIAAPLKLNPANFADLIQRGRLNVRHLVAGNRVRFSQTICLSPDRQWEKELSASDRRVFDLIAGWYARKHGYR